MYFAANSDNGQKKQQLFLKHRTLDVYFFNGGWKAGIEDLGS